MCRCPLVHTLTTMAVCKWSHWPMYFTSTNSQDAVCGKCGKIVRCCGNTTKVVKHLRVNHIVYVYVEMN